MYLIGSKITVLENPQKVLYHSTLLVGGKPSGFEENLKFCKAVQ